MLRMTAFEIKTRCVFIVYIAFQPQVTNFDLTLFFRFLICKIVEIIFCSTKYLFLQILEPKNRVFGPFYEHNWLQNFGFTSLHANNSFMHQFRSRAIQIGQSPLRKPTEKNSRAAQRSSSLHLNYQFQRKYFQLNITALEGQFQSKSTVLIPIKIKLRPEIHRKSDKSRFFKLLRAFSR